MSTLSTPLTDDSTPNSSRHHSYESLNPDPKEVAILPSAYSTTQDTETNDAENIENKDEKEPYRLVILVTMAIFMGYAALVLLQHRLSQAMDLETTVRPRNRVYISLGCMTISMSLLGFVVVLGGSHWAGWSYICYFLGGVAIGTFESNLLTSITPLGHNTKVWAIIGMPSGFAAMSIGGFAFRSLPFICDSDDALASLYILVAGLCLIAMVVFNYYIPDIKMKNNSIDVNEFLINLKKWKMWLPQMKWLAIALACNMFSVSFFSGIMFYILNDRQYVPLLGQLDSEKLLVNHNWFFTIFNCFTFFGDSISRRVVYRFQPKNPLLYLLVSAAGAMMCLARFPLIAPIGIFLVFFANGAIYGTSTRYIDTHISKEFNLIALSVWLFLGDLGSVTGSNVWQTAKIDFCHGSTAKYMCVPPSNVTYNTTCG